jgi:hypothetical protein
MQDYDGVLMIGQRVNTVLGWSTVMSFEVFDEAVHTSYEDPGAGRVEVALDDPSRWAFKNANPYMYRRDILQIWEF